MALRARKVSGASEKRAPERDSNPWPLRYRRLSNEIYWELVKYSWVRKVPVFGEERKWKTLY